MKRTVKVRLKDTAPLDMGFRRGKTYRLYPFKAENGLLFYRRNNGSGIWLQSHFRKHK